MDQLTGVHVYEKRKDDHWTKLGLAVQLLSILSWKSRYGRIELYTNEAHLEDLRAHGLDVLYDKIDTTTLASVEVDTKKWWAFGKIQIAATLTPPFVILDTDLWISDYLNFSKTDSYQAYHNELIVKNNNSGGGYILNYDPIIPKEWIGRWDSKIMPTNTAILRINDSDFAKKWFDCSYTIATLSNPGEIKENLSHSSYMTFIEQRVLPMLATELGKSYSTLVEPIYLSTSYFTNGDEWHPKPHEWTASIKKEFSKIIHVWGLKNQLDDLEIKSLVFKAIEYNFNQYPEAKEFYKLLDYWKD
jgi:hypothetical protein